MVYNVIWYLGFEYTNKQTNKNTHTHTRKYKSTCIYYNNDNKSTYPDTGGINREGREIYPQKGRKRIGNLLKLIILTN